MCVRDLPEQTLFVSGWMSVNMTELKSNKASCNRLWKVFAQPFQFSAVTFTVGSFIVELYLHYDSFSFITSARAKHILLFFAFCCTKMYCVCHKFICAIHAIILYINWGGGGGQQKYISHVNPCIFQFFYLVTFTCTYNFYIWLQIYIYNSY